MSITLGEKEYFKGIDQIQYEGPDSSNPMAYKYYQPDQKVRGKRMEDILRFAIAYWHSFCDGGIDPFGLPTKKHEWLSSSEPIQRAKDKMDAAFEFITKLGVPYFCFHDVDLIDEAPTLSEFEKRLEVISNYGQEKMKASGVKVLWGTSNLFGHPRYMNGAATNPDFSVVARAGAQVKLAMDTTIAMGGENYVFWGGREGYMSLLNTNMKREIDHLGVFLGKARDYARSQGFKGQFFIEPKPMEPTKHQYDFDAATVLGFLREYDLMDDFKLNIEVNHATLAQHTFQHELQVAANAGKLGSIDANRGDYQNGWDTDQFPINLFELVEAMLVIQEAGGFQGGGINFDAKLRRNSTDKEDLFYAHIGGIDAFARALITADKILQDSSYQSLRKERYASFDSSDGKLFEDGKLNLVDLYNIAQDSTIITRSGRQEFFENIINQYL